jgi:hypothetical protein
MLRGERLTRIPERQSQAPATVSHVRGYARGSIGGGGRSGGGGVSDYVACALAVYGVGTLWLRLLAGREQASARACVCRKMSQFQHRETSCIPAQMANG